MHQKKREHPLQFTTQVSDYFPSSSCPEIPTMSSLALGLLYIARGAARVVLIRLGCVVHLSHNLGEQFIYHGFAFG